MGKSLVTGVDIGHHSIKAVVLKPAGDTFTLLGYKEVLVTDDIFADNHSLNYQKIVKKLKELKKGLPRFSRKLVLSVPDNSVISKVLQIDSELEPHEQEFAIHQAFSHQSPFPIEELQLDFVPIVNNFSGQQRHSAFQVYATKRDVIENRVSSAGKAGFQPFLVEVQSHSLINLWQIYSHTRNCSDWMLLDVGHTQTTLCLDFVDKAPFYKQIPVGACDLKYPEKTDSNMDEVTNNADVQEFVEKINKQIQLFMSVHGAQSIAGIWLCGGGSSVPGLLEAISAKVEKPVEVLEPLSVFNDRAGKRHRAEHNLCAFGTAAGLALRGINWLENGHAE